MKSLLASIKAFFWPPDAALRLRRAELTFWAFVLALAYLPLPFGFLAWLALFRPLAIIVNLKGKEVFKAAYFYSFMSNIFILYWVAIVTPPGMIAAVFILSLYPAAVLSLFVRLYHWKKYIGLTALPFLWVGMEYFRSLSEFAFPWTDLAYSQGYYLTFIQIVSVIGSYGLSFIIVILNILVWQFLERDARLERRVSSALAFAGIIVSVYLYGWVVFPPYPEPGKIKVSLLQGNVDLDIKWTPETRDWNFALYDTLIEEAAEDSAHLIVWPETAAPCYPRHEPRYKRMLSESARKSGAYNIVGTLDIETRGDKGKTYNSAFQFAPDGTMSAAYHKVNLVPFSEHVPYQDYFPFLTREFLENYLTFIRTQEVEWWSDFYPGDSIVIFETDQTAYAVLICFESAFPEYIRQCLLKGGEFLVNITNDTWFGRSPGPFQHMRIAVFRAVENRVWIARCANSGISALIDPYGRETVRAGLYERKVITGGLKPLDEYTIFTLHGPVIGRLSLYVTLFLILTVAFFRIVGQFKNKSPR